MAVGEVGLSLKDFYSLTFGEYHYIAKSYMFKDEREWQRTRTLAMLLINVQLDKDKHITPEELIRLPSDIVIDKKKDLPTRDEFEEAVKNFQKYKAKVNQPLDNDFN